MVAPKAASMAARRVDQMVGEWVAPKAAKKAVGMDPSLADR